MEGFGRLLMAGGLLLFLLGGGLFIAARLGLPLGLLPGDIRIEGRNGSFYFPITSSILASILLTALLSLLARWLNK